MLVRQKIKYIQTLGQKKFRQEEGVFIAEGPKLVKELLEADAAAVREVFGVTDWVEENASLLAKTTVNTITAAELERISQLTTPNKVLAIVQQYATSEPISVKGQVILVLDNIQDPGNLGTIIRIADWFGVTQIVCSPDSADRYNSKVVQSTMGSIVRVKLNYTDLEEWLGSQKDIAVYAASLDGKDITSIQKIKEGIIIIGNESKGISDAILQLATTRITIPAKGKAESLNAAVAAGIILSHLL
ncbi:MAG: RNA methyltransferase [Bacteroidota bacterium]|nr:RNA methyltransferase [Bacteroidota bacterium]